ncbi:MAG: hypothetical protein H0T73_14630, partial [Ardenticatenales bacterium]|nr:hypothetical protein [Ardenticatenales bacterium]
ETGLIQAGHGGDGDKDGGAGGTATLLGQTVENSGTVKGGDGGDMLGTGSDDAGSGGDGGDVAIIAGHGGSGKADVPGESTAGAGGKSKATATAAQEGGDGGDVVILSAPVLTANNATIAAGDGAAGAAGGSAGEDGSVTMTAGDGTTGLLSVAGLGTSITGGNITLSAGAGAKVDLSKMSAGAIVASGDVLLAVGTGGTMNLDGNAAPVVSAEGSVTVAASSVTLMAGKTLQQVVAVGAVAGASRNTRAAWLVIPAVVGGQPGQTVTINVIAINSGAGADALNLARSDSANWGLGTLVTPITLAGTRVKDLKLTVTIPQSARVGDTDRVKVAISSQTDSSKQAERYPIVFVDRANSGSVPTTLYLPITTR